MSTTALAIPQTNLGADMDYARAVTTMPDRGAQSLLPKAYQGNPANVLIAMGLGQAIGLTPAQALYEIYVVNGRPSPSANLMAALVRRAGHKLRIDGDTTTCTATLIRADDPEYPFTATWTMEQARAISGLTSKETWKAYPAAMLRARAISEVVRAGASEVVLGMEYSREEMGDVEHDTPPPTVKSPGLAGLRAAVTREEPQDAEVIHAEPETGELRTPAQSTALHAAFTAAGMDRDTAIAYCVNVIERGIDSTRELTKREASAVLDALREDASTDADPWAGQEPTDA
jgi:hypothetical protein